MSEVVEIVGLQLAEGVQDLAIQDQTDMKANCTAVVEEFNQEGCDANSSNIGSHHGICAICLNKIALAETALVKGCEHAYCINCILRWASCKKEPTCPQCKCPFEFLNVHRGLDGSIEDYMFEESVCLLLRALWFKPLVELEREEAAASAASNELDEEFYDDEEEDLNEHYLRSSSRLCISNRRWGDNGYVRSGRLEARLHRPIIQESDNSAGPSRQQRETTSKQVVGRRAKRAQKREAADQAAAAKHQQHLVRLGRN